jgi:hypothetical protein
MKLNSTYTQRKTMKELQGKAVKEKTKKEGGKVNTKVL